MVNEINSICRGRRPSVFYANQDKKRAGTIFRSRLCRTITGKARQEQHRLSLRTLLYSFGLLWFLSGLLALQSALISAGNQNTISYQTAALVQDRQSVQTTDPSGRAPNSTLTAPVRAILTPAFYFNSKALPFGADGPFILPAFFALLAVFISASVLRFQRNPQSDARRSAIRARAPPAPSLF